MRCPTSPASGSQDVLAAVAATARQVGAALAATGSLTLVAGALVLAGAVAAGQRRRIQEAVILKSLGATRRQIRAAWLVEFGAARLGRGVLAAAGGHGGELRRGALRHARDWAFLPGTLAGTVLACLAMMLAFGYLAPRPRCGRKAAPLLRNE